MEDYSFTLDEIRMLADIERRMDSGEQPFVVDSEKRRRAVMPSVMNELGLVSGQSVSGLIIQAILEAQVASVQARIAVDKASVIGRGSDG